MVDELASLGRRGEYAGQFRALGEALADWAGAVGIELRTPPRLTRRRARPRAGSVRAREFVAQVDGRRQV